MHEFVRTPKTPGGQKARSKRLREEETQGPVSGMRWQNRLEEAYKARENFVEFYLKRKIGLRVLLHKLGLQMDELDTAKVFLSKTSPAINIYIDKKPGQLSIGSSQQVFIPAIGKLIVNIIVRKPGEIKITKAHEEEHSNTSLMRHDVKKIENINDVEEIVLNELITYLSEFFIKKRTKKEIKYFFEKKLIKELNKPIIDLIKVLVEFNFDKYRGKSANIVSNILQKLITVTNHISTAYELMEPQLILTILRKTYNLDTIGKDLTDYENQDTERYNENQRNKMFGRMKAKEIARSRKTN